MNDIELNIQNNNTNKGVDDIQQIETDTTQDLAESTDDRNQWTNQLDFLFSVIGFAVDLSNVFRFPYVCYRNGGGAFLIPYFIMLLLITLPMFYLELIMGQFMRCGGLTIWKLTPILKGVGWASMILTFYVALYYNVIIAWSFYYLMVSFSPTLPWTLCNQWWNTEYCFNTSSKNLTLTAGKVDPATEYFENNFLMINKSSGIGDLGPIKWDLMLAVFAVYVIIYFCLFKGVKSLGKAVWVTAILPYIVLTILLIRGLTLKGALGGIVYFIKPNFKLLLNPGVWFEAASQILFSVGVGFSVHIAYASYNNFHQPVHRDCIIAAGVNSFTSLFSGFVVFTYLGYMSETLNRPIEAAAQQNPALIFIVYPQALATLPWAQLWSVLFFVMLFTLGLDSSFGALEAFITGILDEFDYIFKKYKYKREIFTGVLMIVLFLLSLPNTTYGGFFMIKLLDEFSAGLSLVALVLLECIGFVWFFGIDSIAEAVKKMNNLNLHIGVRIIWKFVTPILLFCVVISQIFVDKPVTLQLARRTYQYPRISIVCGHIFAVSSLIIVVFVAITVAIRTKASSCRERIALVISPTEEVEFIRENKTCTRFKRYHWLHV